MKNKATVPLALAAMVALCGLPTVCFAQATEVDTTKRRVELVTVYEKTFTDSIVDVVLDEA